VQEPWATFLDLNVALVVGVAWSLWIQLGPVSETCFRAIQPARHLGVAIAGATTVWALLA
jgi:hypothetical protein